jgi:hypothetical protein
MPERHSEEDQNEDNSSDYSDEDIVSGFGCLNQMSKHDLKQVERLPTRC